MTLPKIPAIDIPELLIESDAGITTITLNRPDQLNAVTHEMHAALAHLWPALRQYPELRCVILTGAGKAFSAGGDVDWFAEIAVDDQLRRDLMAEGRRLVHEMVDFPYPIVCAVNGPAVGLGCSLAMLSDFTFVSERAFFADPHVALGLVAGDGGALSWPVIMGLPLAKEYLFTGDRISAAEAFRIGMTNHVVAPEALMDQARAFARRLAGLPTQALRDTKRALNLHLKRAVETCIDFVFAAESESFARGEFIDRIKGTS
jgi:enoyl-CoA hydratase